MRFTLKSIKLSAVVITLMFLLQTLTITASAAGGTDSEGVLSTVEGNGDGTNGTAGSGNETGPGRGVPYLPLQPLRTAAFVGYDGSGFNDDYAYMAAVPTGVFRAGGKLYGSPVIYYTPPYSGSNEEKTMNSYQGIDYFMQDWRNLTNLSRVQLIGISDADKAGVEKLAPSANYAEIPVSDPYSTASRIALSNWEYSDSAVVAVIDDPPKKVDIQTSSILNGSMPAGEKKTEHFSGEKSPDPSAPTYHNFTIPDSYKYVVADMEWAQYGNPTAPVTERGRDPDMQLYDWQLGEVSASENWNVLSGNKEHCESYVYNTGPWGAAVTYMPTENLVDEEGQGNAPEQSGITTTQYTIDITEYPGIDIPLNNIPGPMTRNAEFTLDWQGSVNLGLLIRGPSGAEIVTNMGNDKPKKVTVGELGEGVYSASVILLDDSSSPVDFTLSYSWNQTREDSYAQGFENAANGAVLASMKNAPLLYTKRGSLPDPTKEALDKLGVTEVYLVASGGESGAADDIRHYRSLFEDKIHVDKLGSPKSVFDKIRSISGEDDIVFTTVNPWSFWHVGTGPLGEEEGGLYVGPAALAGAFHGAPVVVTDAHSVTSSANAWHNEFWKKAYPNRLPPSVGCMVLTGRAVYSFLDSMGLNGTGKESILTVAGQFDIGTSWDRMLVGAAFSGRINGAPTDTAYWVSRSALYQVMIFANPSVAGKVEMEQGTSYAEGILSGKTVSVHAPVLQSWVSYQHRFNERGSQYWVTKYETADGIVPFDTPSDNPIDDGCNGNHKSGQYWPDLTVSEVVPFYAEKAGYASVFSTNFDITMSNLNKGAVMWLEIMHGGNGGSGVVGFWNSNQPETNPWRGYEKGYGSTIDPDSMRMDKNTGADLEPGYDGIVIAIAEQLTQTEGKNGYDFDNGMKNIHSVGFSAGSCLIANTYLHLSLVRHGGVFQIIDPWLTSWYCGFAIETFARDIALGYSVGEAYERAISHVGILYLTNQWWWDIFENVVYFGDPDLHVYSPKYSWNEPAFFEGQSVSGHSIAGASDHPNEIHAKLSNAALPIIGIVAVGAAVVVYFKYYRRGKEGEMEEVEYEE